MKYLRSARLTLASFCLLSISSTLSAQEATTAGATTAAPPEFIYLADAFNGHISGFHLLSDGALAATPGSPYSVAVNPPITEAPLSLAYIAPFLVAANSDPNSRTGMTVFKVNQATGALTHVAQPGPQTTFVDWEVLAADPHHRLVFAVGEDNSASQSNGLATFRLTTTGVLQRVAPLIERGPQSGTLALDPLGRFLYMLHAGQVWVWSRKLDGTLGAQVSGSPFKVGTPPVFSSPSSTDPCFDADSQPIIAVHPNGHVIYTSCNQGQIVTASLVSSTGRISPLSSVALHTSLDRISALAVDRAGTLMFGTMEQRHEVVTFALSSSGRPSLKSVAAAGARPNGVAVDPAMHHLFVTNGSSLIFKGDLVSGSSNMSFYVLSSGGTATQSSQSPVSTGADPRWPVIVIGQ